MFGWKLIRQSKYDKQQAEQFKHVVETLNKLADGVIKRFNNIPMGDLTFLASTSSEFNKLNTMITNYNNNKFSSPSGGNNLFFVMEEVQKVFGKVVTVQTKAKEIEINIKDVQLKYNNGDMTVEEVDKFRDVIVKQIDECNAIMALYLEQLISFMNTIKATISGDLINITEGIDIIDKYYKDQKFKDEGRSYTVKYKMTTKDKVLDNKNNEEDFINGKHI